MKRIVLCADDYGQAEPISQGILALIQHGRLSATSCMVNMPHWHNHAKRLSPFVGLIDIGLHFNLTEGKALSKTFIKTYGDNLFSLPGLMRKAFMRRSKMEAIEAECLAQIDRFAESLGFLPNFIDGHQHIQHFPIVRLALLNAYEKRLRSQKSYIRLAGEKFNFVDLIKDFKKAIISATGTKAFKRLLSKHHIPHNESFSGIYAFSKGHRYHELFPRFLKEIRDRGIIMCHPGLSSSGKNDPIAASRYQEYRYLNGNQFLIDCYSHGVTLNRFFR